MALSDIETTGQSEWESFRDSNLNQLQQTREQLIEAGLLLKQSQDEVDRLAQRNAEVTVQLGQIHSKFETVPRQEIRKAYEAALDAQGRLFNMRGKLENFQNNQQHLQQRVALLERIDELLTSSQEYSQRSDDATAGAETLEMLIQTQETERQRLSRQMHDGPAQSLSNFILQTEIALRLMEYDESKAREELASLKDTATTAFRKVRDFIFELRPMMLDDLGLVPTVKKYVEAFNDQTGVETSFILSGDDRRLESYIEVLVFRAIQELLRNAVDQGHASNIKLHLDLAESYLRVNIEDNGRGFDVEQFDQNTGMGLKLIEDRVKMLGGTFELDSVPGQGSRILFQIPVTSNSTSDQADSGQ